MFLLATVFLAWFATTFKFISRINKKKNSQHYDYNNCNPFQFPATHSLTTLLLPTLKTSNKSHSCLPATHSLYCTYFHLLSTHPNNTVPPITLLPITLTPINNGPTVGSPRRSCAMAGALGKTAPTVSPKTATWASSEPGTNPSDMLTSKKVKKYARLLRSSSSDVWCSWMAPRGWQKGNAHEH